MKNDKLKHFYILWFWAIIKEVSCGNGDTPSVFWAFLGWKAIQNFAK